MGTIKVNVDVSGAGQYSDKGGASPIVMDPDRSTDTLMPIRQLFESVNDTRQSHSSLPLRGRSMEGLAARITRRLLAVTVWIWRNHVTDNGNDPILQLLHANAVSGLLHSVLDAN